VGKERGDMTGVICQFLAYLLCFSSTGISIMDGGWIDEAHRPLPERRANSILLIQYTFQKVPHTTFYKDLCWALTVYDIWLLP
jgi:hypothetical protein